MEFHPQRPNTSCSRSARFSTRRAPLHLQQQILHHQQHQLQATTTSHNNKSSTCSTATTTSTTSSVGDAGVVTPRALSPTSVMFPLSFTPRMRQQQQQQQHQQQKGTNKDLGTSLCDTTSTSTTTSSPNNSFGDLVRELTLAPPSCSSLSLSPSASLLPGVRILVALVGLLATPFAIYQCFPASTLAGNLHTIKNVWDALLRTSSVSIAVVALAASMYFGPCILSSCKCCSSSGSQYCTSNKRHHHQQEQQQPMLDEHEALSISIGTSSSGSSLESPSHDESCQFHSTTPDVKPPSAKRALLCRLRALCLSVDGFGIFLAFAIAVPLSLTSSMPLLVPAWAWYPLGWFDYHVYLPSELAPALQGVCPDQPLQQVRLPSQKSILRRVVSSTLSQLGGYSSESTAQQQQQQLPLCLSERSWKTLSAGALSSYRAQDVKTVFRGIDYARHQESHGLVIAVLARDISNDLQPFRQNVESLLPFFPRLAVVIFENDSTDGSRQAIREWANAVALKGHTSTSGGYYHVDLMECEEAPDCLLGKLHRDSNNGDYSHSKAVGDMDIYRQRVTNYITGDPKYENFSHMMVLDIDLAISLSPLGVLHTLGEHPENAVASSGHMLFPTSYGSLQTPYDFSAFRPVRAEANHWVLRLHERWCGLMPAGDRWRNSCDVSSPLLMMEMLRYDRGNTDTLGGGDDDKDSADFYRVESAFNGAALYPLDLIRESQATYDAGEDGQRCEHIGFNLGLKKPMYVNRRWDMHVDPTNPGGPTGWRAQNAVSHVTTNPRLISSLLLVQLASYITFVYSMTMLGLFLVYPLLMAPLMSSGTVLKRIHTSHQRRQQRNKRGRQSVSEETLFKIV